MNLLHLKYALVIADTHSMTKAAEVLFTSQPNLSRSLRELEEKLGITIFTRSSRGLRPTPQGEEFLGYARQVLRQVDALENMYSGRREMPRRFSVSAPRASYISCAFTAFAEGTAMDSGTELFYKETNPSRVISNVTEDDYKLGILRFQTAYEKNFRKLLDEKELSSELVFDFSYLLLMSREHPLAGAPEIRLADLKPYVEITHADPFVPSLSLSAARKNEQIAEADRHIYVFERGSQMDILSASRSAFMWVSPVPQRLLDRFGLVQRSCAENDRRYRDLLVWRSGYNRSALDAAFIRALQVERDGLPAT